jgi:hypothetical protein
VAVSSCIWDAWPVHERRMEILNTILNNNYYELLIDDKKVLYTQRILT